MELFDLSGQVAVVTGSSQGIGRAIANRLAEHGARVVFSSRTLADCEACALDVNRRWGEQRSIAVACDASDRTQLAQLVERTLDQWGRLDTLVCNALVSGDASPIIERLNENSFTDWFEGNATNNAYLVKLVAPHMRRQGGGSVMFITSTAGIAALEDYLGYGASKAALNQMARILAVQLGADNIRVNAIAPGIVASRGPEQWGTAQEQRVGVGETPLGRLGTPDEIASCAVWLASKGGAFVTGQVIAVDGGQTLRGMSGPHRLRDFRRASRTVG